MFRKISILMMLSMILLGCKSVNQKEDQEKEYSVGYVNAEEVKSNLNMSRMKLKNRLNQILVQYIYGSDAFYQNNEVKILSEETLDSNNYSLKDIAIEQVTMNNSEYFVETGTLTYKKTGLKKTKYSRFKDITVSSESEDFYKALLNTQTEAVRKTLPKDKKGRIFRTGDLKADFDLAGKFKVISQYRIYIE